VKGAKLELLTKAYPSGLEKLGSQFSATFPAKVTRKSMRYRNEEATRDEIAIDQ
jgi:hypothetical protein